jgi:hypothetical protein
MSAYSRLQGQVDSCDRVSESMSAEHEVCPTVVSILIVGRREERAQERLARHIDDLPPERYVCMYVCMYGTKTHQPKKLWSLS